MKLPIIDTGVAPVAPELCAVGNILMAIWNDGAGMSYTTRRVWKPIPYLSSWMSPLASQTPISHLTIPGTHDSAAVSLVPLVSTQYLDIGAQLRAGIRYIDLRAGFSNDINDKNFRGLPDDLIAYHGPYRLRHSLNPTSPDYITIREIFEQCYNFLNDTDSSQECILMQIKQDYPAKPNDALECLFADAMMDLINEHERFNPGRLIWRLDSTLPTLAEVRGRIQLIRRFRGVIQDITPSGLPMAPGINVSIGWPNNGSGEIYPSGFIFQDPGFRIVLQDKWDWPFDFAARANKFKLVKQGLEAAKKDKNPKRWHINFASATAVYALMDGTRIALGKEVQQPDDSGRPSPIDDYGVNKRLSDFFSKAPKGHYGTILMDYAELPGDLILGIIRTNEFPG
jgi:1-phosphatidylinositol phosphodiesterase